jgi:hypothetical protein
MYLDPHRVHELFADFTGTEGRGIDLAPIRHEHDVSVKVLRRRGDVEIVAVM